MLEMFEKFDQFSRHMMYVPMTTINWFFVLIFVTIACWIFLLGMSAWADRRKATRATTPVVLEPRQANVLTNWERRALTELGSLGGLSVSRISALANQLRVALTTEGLSFEDASSISHSKAQSLWGLSVRARRKSGSSDVLKS